LFGDTITLDRGVLKPFDVSHHDGEVCVVEDYVRDITAAQRELLDRSKAFQDDVVDKRLARAPDAPTTFAVGDYVLVTYPNRPPTKLTPRWRGPMIIVEVRSAAVYVCQDLCTLKCKELHVSRLKLYDMRTTDDATSVAAADQSEWMVDSIVAHRFVDGYQRKRGRRPGKNAYEFLVRWLGFDASEDTWLPYKEVCDLEALDVYARVHPELRL